MIVKLLTEHHLELLSLKGGCRGSSEYTHVKMLHCSEITCTGSLLFSMIKFSSLMAHTSTIKMSKKVKKPLKTNLSILPHLFMDGSRMGDNGTDPKGWGSPIFHIYVGVAHFLGSQFEYQKCDIRSQYERQNWVLNVKMRYSSQIGIMSKNKKKQQTNEKRKAKNEKQVSSPCFQFANILASKHCQRLKKVTYFWLRTSKDFGTNLYGIHTLINFNTN